MNTNKFLLAGLLASAFAPALAAEPNVEFNAASFAIDEDTASSAPVVRERMVVRSGDIGMMHNFDALQFGAPMLFGRVIKNAPYSGEAVSEQSQVLADGNQINKKTSTLQYRDSAGRTRQETRGDDGVLRAITIHDPVAGSTFILRPDTKVATKIGAHRDFARAAADKAAAAGEKARAAGERARELAEKMRDDAHEVIVKRIERNEGGDPGKQIRENIRIRTAINMEGKPMPGVIAGERLGPMIAGAFGDMKWSSKVTSKDLGSKEIDGVKATGKLRSYEIPAGEIGNRNPIVVSTETWYAPDLQVTLYSKHSDPRSGERIYRIASLKRDEPAASLFAVPSDYTVKDVVPAMLKRIDEKK